MITSCYPVLMATDVAATAAFFETHFDFERTFAADWYVSLRAGASELAVVAVDHPTVPAGSGTPAAGLLVNIEVDDVDATYARLVGRAGLRPRLELRTETFGQRRFVVEAPGGVLVDVITPIPPGEEHVEAFVPARVVGP